MHFRNQKYGWYSWESREFSAPTREVAQLLVILNLRSYRNSISEQKQLFVFSKLIILSPLSRHHCIHRILDLLTFYKFCWVSPISSSLGNHLCFWGIENSISVEAVASMISPSVCVFWGHTHTHTHTTFPISLMTSNTANLRASCGSSFQWLLLTSLRNLLAYSDLFVFARSHLSSYC